MYNLKRLTSFAVQRQMPPPPNLLGYPDMAPPSYAAAVGEKETNIADDNDQHTFGNLSYVPVYTYAQPYQVMPDFNFEYLTGSLVRTQHFLKN